MGEAPITLSTLRTTHQSEESVHRYPGLGSLVMFFWDHWELDGCLFWGKGVTLLLGIPLGSIQSQP